MERKIQEHSEQTMATNNAKNQVKTKLPELQSYKEITEISKQETDQLILVLISKKYPSRWSFESSFNWWWQDVETANPPIRFYHYIWYDDDETEELRSKNLPAFKAFYDRHPSNLSLEDLNKYIQGNQASNQQNAFTQEAFTTKIKELCKQHYSQNQD